MEAAPEGAALVQSFAERLHELLLVLLEGVLMLTLTLQHCGTGLHSLRPVFDFHLGVEREVQDFLRVERRAGIGTIFL